MQFIELDNGNFTLKLGNPKIRNRKRIYKILKTNYGKDGKIYNTYCVQKFNSKTLDYFVEIIRKGEFEKVITTQSLKRKKQLNLKDCRDIINLLMEG